MASQFLFYQRHLIDSYKYSRKPKICMLKFRMILKLGNLKYKHTLILWKQCHLFYRLDCGSEFYSDGFAKVEDNVIRL